MGNFFNSEIIQEELMEINELQTSVYHNTLSFETMERDDQLEHIDELIELLEKQRVMFTRLSLSDDPEAKSMKKQLQQSIEVMGFPKGTDMSILFHGMEQTIRALKQKIDA